MGGHGGLNILPQKRWNVYNFDNRERVRRDEEAAAREEQDRRQKARQAELEYKLDKLREIAHAKRRRLDAGAVEGEGSGEGAARLTLNGVSEGAIVLREGVGSGEQRAARDDGAERPQRHINLFADFEARAAAEEAKGERRSGRHDRDDRGRKGKDAETERGKDVSRKERGAGRGVEKVDGKPTGEPVNENYGLGHGAVDKNGKKPWYMYKSFMIDRTREEQEKATTTSSPAPDRKAIKAGKKTVEELRAERLRREQQEKDKVRKLVSGRVGVSLPGGGFAGVREPRYHGSFGNSRR